MDENKPAATATTTTPAPSHDDDTSATAQPPVSAVVVPEKPSSTSTGVAVVDVTSPPTTSSASTTATTTATEKGVDTPGKKATAAKGNRGGGANPGPKAPGGSHNIVATGGNKIAYPSFSVLGPKSAAKWPADTKWVNPPTPTPAPIIPPSSPSSPSASTPTSSTTSASSELPPSDVSASAASSSTPTSSVAAADSAVSGGQSSLVFDNHGKDLASNPMFLNAVHALEGIKHLLSPGLIYHGEYLGKPIHNVSVYERRPKRYVILYDIFCPDSVGQSGAAYEAYSKNVTGGRYFTPDELAQESGRIGLECVQTVFVHNAPSEGNDDPHVVCERFINEGKITSCLGGTDVEGYVIKLFDIPPNVKDAPPRISKVLASKFKEKHNRGVDHATVQTLTVEGIVDTIGNMWNVEARFRKAVQHLQEQGFPEKSRDIVGLSEELDADLKKEATEEIMCYLWGDLKTYMLPGLTAGLGKWYVNKYLTPEQIEAYNKVRADIETAQPATKRAETMDSAGRTAIFEEAKKYSTPELWEEAVRNVTVESHSDKNVPKYTEWLRNYAENQLRPKFEHFLWEFFAPQIMAAARKDLAPFVERLDKL
ncbi:RNA ligase [Pelomyxa schiedti]|nr:RNA ligase [Pelomyxa schiedti]